MRIIRPYGQSATEQRQAGPIPPQRVLRLREALQPDGGGAAERDIVEFAGSHDSLVIAQWISTIDKIATKPRGNGKPTEAQRDLRAKLGDAAWALIVDRGLLPGLASDKHNHLQKLWRFKIHPYPQEVAEAKRDKDGNPKPEPKGRWYARFAGDAAPGGIDAAAVARRIHEHLHEAEYRISARSPKKHQGRITARAQSIAANVLQPKSKVPPKPTWSAEDRAEYEAKVGNITQAIRDAATAREDGKDGAGTRRVGPDVAGKVLFRAWADLFVGDPPPFAEVRDRRPGLVSLHEAIRDRYRRTLKRHGKDQRSHGERRRKVSDLLPATMEELLALVDHTLANRDLNGLVRLGKVIHYEAAARYAADLAAGGEPVTAGDEPAHVVRHWPDDIGRSRYWTSDGQAEIKRNEAFVRVWRHSLALARQTLTDWADPKGAIDEDILLARGIDQATGKKRFDPVQHGRKLEVLLGRRAAIFTEGRSEDFKKRTLRLALESMAQLRHKAFHFNGLGGFTRALQFSDRAVDEDLRAAIRDLWVADIEGRAGRLRQTMQASHFGDFLSGAQNRKLFDAVFGAMNKPKDDEVAPVPLPRFRRLLDRAAGIAGKGNIVLRLPEPANRLKLEEVPARLCQYVALKLLYEHPFRNWLRLLDAATLNDFIDRAVAQAEKAAKTNFGRRDADREAVITAKARDLVRLAEHESIQDFLFRLSAETASEMRVQSGYESDSERAKEQAGYIENLRSDVLAQAFDCYLEEKGFLFVVELPANAEKAATPLCDLEGLAQAEVDATVEDWQALLYLLLHLIPVDDVGRLLHQIRKWDLLAGKGDADTSPAARRAQVAKLTQALELYLDMHDAKFEGDAVLGVVAEFKQLFQSEGAFDRLFGAPTVAVDDGRLPRRGLREIRRFGHLPSLVAVFQRRAVADAEVDELLAAETDAGDPSPIARAQGEREGLHGQWSEDQKGFKGEDCRRYVEALVAVTRHRHSAAHVMLGNHVRLHRLMMAVLGRLVDFSGLWERDLYFATLALLHQEGLTPTQAFSGDGLSLLSGGQIVAARDQLNAPIIKADLTRRFLTHGRRQIRNDLAHFNMINAAKTNGQPPDLTACVNATRRLMTHDRKLKNAVAHSVIELLKREGFELSWDMDTTAGEHCLTNARIATRQATHLGSLKLPEVRKSPNDAKPIVHLVRESLHGQRLVDMVADLFAGTRRNAGKDVSQIPIERIDWRNVNRPMEARPHRPDARKGQGDPGGKSHRRQSLA